MGYFRKGHFLYLSKYSKNNVNPPYDTLRLKTGHRTLRVMIDCGAGTGAQRPF